MSQEFDFSTPMMQQYMQLKNQYADCLLWFRLGDFYEMFLEHAKIGSEILGITLTSRSRGKDGRIPMAGIPYHAADNYLAKLVNAGYKVAICEQVSEPNGKTLVDREVIRIVTPGTLLDEKILHHKENNYLLSLHVESDKLGVAVSDVSTGEFRVGEIDLSSTQSLEQSINEVMLQFGPAECILPPAQSNEQAVTLQHILSQYPRLHISSHQDWSHWIANYPQFLKHFHLPSQSDLAGQHAAAALFGYLQHTQKAPLHHLHTVLPLFSTRSLQMNRSTILNLELFTTLYDHNPIGSLRESIDFTSTAMGGRLLKQWLHKPLTDKSAIEERLEAVSYFVDHRELRHQLKELLQHILDIERLLSRLSVKLGTPRDLKNIQVSLQFIFSVAEKLHQTPLSLAKTLSPKIQKTLTQLIEVLDLHLIEQPQLDPKAGSFIKDGIHPQLDTLRQTVTHSKDWLLALEMSERKKTGISTLKIKFNQVFGFYIEITNANLHLVPESYTRKQTLVNAERFTTPELKHHEEIILSAEIETSAIEYELFLQLVEKLLKEVATLQHTAHWIAEIDCLLGFAELAEQRRYVRPQLNTKGHIKITAGRHPVVEQLVQHHQFVPNSLELNSKDQQMMLITGPNMAGKSVLMRQVALITLLAHMGCFVPAEKADISITDQIFVRSGAADMITAGLSTFMVEMVETAYILHHATEQSLIIMDEIGRGTSTYDGISIAWSVAEFLAQTKQSPKTLFATHYHELQQLAEKYPDKIHNFHMGVTEHQGTPIFLYTLKTGGASHSYGVAVAQLAGVPEKVIERATHILKELEQRNADLNHSSIGSTTPTTATQQIKKVTKITAIEKQLQELNLDKITPIEALNILSNWKKR
jgi:DNA mismatch repair protein MutS